MAEVKIRDLDAAVVKKLDQLAREKKMSRESFLRQFLTSIAALEESNHLIGKQEEAFQKMTIGIIELTKDVRQLLTEIRE
ncbi:hypothetical protein [Listeria monocytogenes]|uniref:hypothetical protein n=1 Tax=Listeria monocytogenes TaxID=1639 RepID=UPI0015DA2947|nr:hypothetical protein [Listeria monocytogenes]